MSIAVFITEMVLHLNYVISVVLSFLDVIKSKILWFYNQSLVVCPDMIPVLFGLGWSATQ